nr:MAG TPA: hypothetical protein [Caudoviricetes sp.]
MPLILIVENWDLTPRARERNLQWQPNVSFILV